jgi:hypothetical protein
MSLKGVSYFRGCQSMIQFVNILMSVLKSQVQRRLEWNPFLKEDGEGGANDDSLDVTGEREDAMMTDQNGNMIVLTGTALSE